VPRKTTLAHPVSDLPSTCAERVKDSDSDAVVVRQGEGNARVEKLASQTRMKVQPGVYVRVEVMK